MALFGRRKSNSRYDGGRPISPEDLEHFRTWSATRAGIDGYVEPATVVNPVSLLLVDILGEYTRRPIGSWDAADRLGRELGFAVYAIFPVLLIVAPPDVGVLAALFAFSGLRFAGLPAHKALIVGPAERGAGGRVTGSYYLVRNVVVIPSAALGGVLYGGLALPGVGQVLAGSPPLAFATATVVGLLGTGYFFFFGEEFATAGG